MPRLRRSDCSQAGFVRRRRGRGFEYLDADGARIDDEETLERIRALAIPPAWRDVWICADPLGHLQAVGVDAAGRKQYRYHDAWRVRKDREKFETMLDFARTLPRLRRTVSRDLAREGLGRKRVLACAVRLLDRGFFRVGGEEYAGENGSYGLATIHKRHVRVNGDGLVLFDYEAKGGKRRVQSIVDPEAEPVIAALKRRRGGPELLAYRNGRWVDVRSGDINSYIKDATGGDFSAKDFRTWHGTVLAAVALAVAAPKARSRTGRKRAIRYASEEVAHYLGNTPAVCRASYIDPRVVDSFQAGVTIAPALDGLGDVDTFGTPATQGAIEKAVLQLLSEETPSVARRAA